MIQNIIHGTPASGVQQTAGQKEKQIIHKGQQPPGDVVSR
jgi:hypothetical protein